MNPRRNNISCIREQLARTKPIKGGHANSGMFLHTLIDGRNVVEKITSSHHEARIARFFLDNPRDYAPIIYGIEHEEINIRIFMEFLPSAGIPPSPLKDVHISLRKALRSIAFDEGFSNFIDKDIVSRIDGDLILNYIPTLPISRFHHLCHIYSTMERILCHNDIYWPNLALVSPKHFKIIDFATMGWNSRGADLHHFAWRGIWNAGAERLLGRVAKAHAKDMRTSEEHILFAAYFYAFVRSARRVTQRARDGLSNANEMEHTLLLFGLANQIAS